MVEVYILKFVNKKGRETYVDVERIQKSSGSPDLQIQPIKLLKIGTNSCQKV